MPQLWQKVSRHFPVKAIPVIADGLNCCIARDREIVMRPENWTTDRRLLCNWLSVQATELNRLDLSH